MTQNLGLADRIFLMQKTPQTPQHVAALGTFTLPEDAPADYIERLVERFRDARHFAAPFNQVLRRPSLKSVAPSFVELSGDQVDLEYHFRHNALPSPGGERQLGVLVSSLHSRPLDLGRPLWEFHVIEGLAGRRFAIYIKLHHSLFDGIGGARLMSKMLTTDEADGEIRPLWTLGRSPSRRATSVEPTSTRPTLPRFETARGLARRTARLARDIVRPSDPDLATPYRIPDSATATRCPTSSTTPSTQARPSMSWRSRSRRPRCAGSRPGAAPRHSNAACPIAPQPKESACPPRLRPSPTPSCAPSRPRAPAPRFAGRATTAPGSR